MNFLKQNKKYFFNELQHNISNHFSFSIKDLQRTLKPLEAESIPPSCSKCSYPLSNPKCVICSTQNEIEEELKLEKNFMLKKKLNSQEGEMEESVIICVDLSGSMGLTYPSKCRNIKEELTSCFFGQQLYKNLRQKIKANLIADNKDFITMELKQGVSIREIARSFQNQYSLGSEQYKTGKQAEFEEYVSRKDIISVAISKYLSNLKLKKPKTKVTIVYFNEDIEIPFDNFNEKITLSGIETKTLEQMIELGFDYAQTISVSRVDNIGDCLLKNLTTAEVQKTTAMTPALAFCFGLAKKWNYSLNQIVVVTDGESNIGFGRTQGDLPAAELEQTKKLFQRLALEYANPLNCVVNVITFEDCVISYDIIDQLVGRTNGLPCQIAFEQEAGNVKITQDSMTNFEFNMIESFVEYPRQFCFNSKVTIACSKKNIKLRVPENLQHCTIVDPDTNNLIIKSSIKSTADVFKIEFCLEEGAEQFDGAIRFTIVSQFEKNNKKTTTVRTDTITVAKGSVEKAEQSQAVILQKEIKNKLRNWEFFEEDLDEYKAITEKLEQNEKLKEGLNQQLLKGFEMKKIKLAEMDKNIDKLQREKMSMKSRAHKTFKQKDYDDDDGDDDYFK